MERNKLLDIVKGIAIILVVIGHFDLENLSPYWYFPVRNIFYFFHIPLFFLIAGYLFGKYEAEKLKPLNIKHYVEFIQKKAQRLLIPYVSVTFLVILIKSMVERESIAPTGQLLKQFLTGDPQYGPFLWFLYAMFIVLILSPLLIAVMRNQFNLLLLAAYTIFVCSDIVNLHGLSRALGFMLPFLTGYIASSNKVLEKIANFQYLLIPTCISVIIFVLLFKNRDLCNTRLSQCNFRLLVSYSGMIATFFVAVLLQKTGFSQFFSIPGKLSMYIYLFHTLCCNILFVIIKKLIPITQSNATFIMITVWLAGIIGPILLYQFVFKRVSLLNFIFSGNIQKKHTAQADQ